MLITNSRLFKRLIAPSTGLISILIGDCKLSSVLGLYARVSRRNERDECLSHPSPSATPVVIFMSRAFRSKEQEKGDTARSLSDKYQRN